MAVITKITKEKIDSDTGDILSSETQQRERAVYYEDFVNFFGRQNDILAKILSNAALRILFMFYCRCQKNNNVNLDIKQISLFLGISRQTVSSGINELIGYEIIFREKHNDKRKNVYVISPFYGWRGKSVSRLIALRGRKKVPIIESDECSSVFEQ
jgi:DNA-binding MarR family transcriptional regulator